MRADQVIAIFEKMNAEGRATAWLVTRRFGAHRPAHQLLSTLVAAVHPPVSVAT